MVTLTFLKPLYSRKGRKPENSRIFDLVFVELRCICCVMVAFEFLIYLPREQVCLEKSGFTKTFTRPKGPAEFFENIELRI